MAVPAKFALGTLRLTLGRNTSEDDIDQAADAITRALSRPTT
jgi:cysteine sulfinate desulfinase/cysteine desulfurase-like protein